MSDTSRIAQFYDRLVEQHGYSVHARDSMHESSLATRYRVLCDVADLEGRRILEVGCGFGDLGKYILDRSKGVTYMGIDISAAMIETGRGVHPALALHHADLLSWTPPQQFDIVLAQGIFYLLGEDAENKMHRLIRRMFGLAEVAVAFCTLSAWADSRDEGEFYADPLRTLEMCRSCTPHVALRHDYLPNDFTVYLYRSSLSSKGANR